MSRFVFIHEKNRNKGGWCHDDGSAAANRAPEHLVVGPAALAVPLVFGIILLVQGVALAILAFRAKA